MGLAGTPVTCRGCWFQWMVHNTASKVPRVLGIGLYIRNDVR